MTSSAGAGEEEVVELLEEEEDGTAFELSEGEDGVDGGASSLPLDGLRGRITGAGKAVAAAAAASCARVIAATFH